MNDCTYCNGNCPEQVDKNGNPLVDHTCKEYQDNAIALHGIDPACKTEYPTHSTVGGYTIAYITTDSDCYCGNCIADVIESDIHLLPESRIRDYDYPLDTILYQDTSEHPTLCESCSTDISN